MHRRLQAADAGPRSTTCERAGSTASAQVCDPADVDVVVCTHLHVDHVGWNTTLQDGRWVPTFPNARYLFTAADYEFFASSRGAATLSFHGDYFADSVQPIVDAGLADLVAPDHRVDDALSLFHTPGHTVGHVGVRVESAGEAAALTGDLVHSPLQCVHPTWSTSACADRAQAARSRIDFFEHAVETQLLVVPAHFPSPTACRLHRDGSGYGFRYLGDLDDTDAEADPQRHRLECPRPDHGPGQEPARRDHRPHEPRRLRLLPADRRGADARALARSSTPSSSRSSSTASRRARSPRG